MRKIFVAAGYVALALIGGCGGGGGGGSSAPAPVKPDVTGAADNVQPVSVELQAANPINNILFTTITVCAPNSSNCQQIDHIAVDTASTGLRIVSSALASSLSLVQQTDGTGNPIVECAQFATGVTWGSVKRADVKIAGEQALSVPIQVISDPAFPNIPASCSARGVSLAFFANGLLGIGPFQHDCGNTCAQNTTPRFYFACPTPSGCQDAVVPLTQQVQNPVALFAADNNGIIVQLPAIPATGAATVNGSLVFGIGTRANNALGNATVFPLNPNNGTFTTVYKNQTLLGSFADTGSNALFFPDSTIPLCTGGDFYCPTSALNLSATIQAANGTTATINFSVDNASTLVQNNPNAAAFNNLAGPPGVPNANSFDWGLPFYFGRTVFTAISGANTPGGPGPYIAF
jgi:uncharacterized protein DUF3443